MTDSHKASSEVSRSILQSQALYLWLPSWGNAVTICLSALVAMYLKKTAPGANLTTAVVALTAILTVSLAYARVRLFPLRAFWIGGDVVAAHTPEQALQVAYDELGEELGEGAPVTLSNVLPVGDKELDAPMQTDDGADATTLREDLQAASGPRYLAYCPKD